MWRLPAEKSVDVGPSVAVCGDGDLTFVGVNLELAVRDECAATEIAAIDLIQSR
jgi:hypothetical protein